MAAAKRVVSLRKIYNELKSKSDDLFKEIDNWSARIDLLQKLDTSRTDFSFSNISKFLEFFNFLSGEYDLLYHGQIKVGEAIMDTRDGYSHDFLRGHLAFVGNKIKNASNDNPLKNTMRNTLTLADLKLVSKGTTLVDGLNLLKLIIFELEKKLPKKFIIEMQETGSYTPYVYCIKDGKTKQSLDRYKRIDFEQRLKDHPWSPAPRKKRQAVSSKTTAVSSKITSSSSEIVVQSISSWSRRRIVDDDDSPQATPSSKDTSSKLQAFQFELPLTATRAVVHEDSPQPSPSISTALIAPPPELMQQSDEVALIQIPHDSLSNTYPFTNSKAISISKEEGSTNEFGMMVREYLISDEENARGNFEHVLYSIKLFTELR
jgi:hypothetical protein